MRVKPLAGHRGRARARHAAGGGVEGLISGSALSLARCYAPIVVLIERTVAALTIAGVLVGACGGKTDRDPTSSGTEEPSSPVQNGGSVVDASVSGASFGGEPASEGGFGGRTGASGAAGSGAAGIVYGIEGPSCSGMTGTECNGELL